jgi:hypothetical protein
MSLVRTAACLVAALLSVLAVSSAAAPFPVRLGNERLVLDAPPGFADTTELASPRLQAVAETLLPATNRILVFALSDDDLRRFMLGDPVDARRYLIAATPKGMEHQRVSQEMFAIHVNDSLAGLGAPVNPPELVPFLREQPIGKAFVLSELKREPGMASILQCARMPDRPATTFWGSPTPRNLCYTTTLFLIRGKALRLGAYAIYENQAEVDLDWLKSITKRWQEELLRLNRDSAR